MNTIRVLLRKPPCGIPAPPEGAVYLGEGPFTPEFEFNGYLWHKPTQEWVQDPVPFAGCCHTHYAILTRELHRAFPALPKPPEGGFRVPLPQGCVYIGVPGQDFVAGHSMSPLPMGSGCLTERAHDQSWGTASVWNGTAKHCRYCVPVEHLSQIVFITQEKETTVMKKLPKPDASWPIPKGWCYVGKGSRELQHELEKIGVKTCAYIWDPTNAGNWSLLAGKVPVTTNPDNYVAITCKQAGCYLGFPEMPTNVPELPSGFIYVGDRDTMPRDLSSPITGLYLDKAQRVYSWSPGDDMLGRCPGHLYALPVERFWEQGASSIEEPKKEMNVQAKLIEMLGIKTGDYVKVLGKAPNGHLGWKSNWIDAMDAMIGETLQVTNVESMGIIVSWDGRKYDMPAQVLQKVEDPHKKLGNYFVRRTPDGGRTIGCKTLNSVELVTLTNGLKVIRDLAGDTGINMPNGQCILVSEILNALS